MSDLTMFRGDNARFTVQVTADGSAIDPSATLWFVAKHSLLDHDARAVFLLSSDTDGGVQRDVPAQGYARATVRTTSTARLTSKVTRLEYVWRMREADGAVSTIETGVLWVYASSPLSLSSALIGGGPPPAISATLAALLGDLGLSSAISSVVGPQPDDALYADVPASLATGATLADGQAITAWSWLTTITGAPKLVADTVNVGSKVVRTKAGSKLQSAPGAAAYMSTGPSTAVIACRFPKYNSGTSFVLFDKTDGGTVAGYQIVVDDNNADFYGVRVISVRIFDGTTWILDRPVFFQTGHFIPLHDHIITVRIDGTKWDIHVDGKPTRFDLQTISLTFPTTSTGRVTLGGGPVDYRAVELYSWRLDDADRALVELRISARFGTELIARIAGLIDLYNPPTPRHVSFPWATALSSNVIDVTCFAGQTEAPANVNTVLNVRSADGGYTYGAPVVLYQSDSVTRYADPHTLKMSNGHLLRLEYTYDITDNGTKFWAQTSTDGGNTYSALVDITSQIGGTPVWIASGAAPIEDPDNPGHIHWAIYTKENSPDTGQSAWHTKSLDFGATWQTRTLMSNGQALAKQWNEPQLLFHSSGEMRALIRERVNMWVSRSLDKGATWAAFVDIGIVSYSAGQSYMQLASGGDELWFGRGGPYLSATLYWRAAGAAWNDPWENTPDALYMDPRTFGAFGYGTIIEQATKLLLVYATTTGDYPTTYSDVCSRHVPKWIYRNAMPGSVSPATANINVGATQQLTITGAGEPTYNVTGGIGGSVDANGVFTAGSANGTATATVLDRNGKQIGMCVFTVSGASAGLNPTTITGATSAYRADHATNTGDNTPITAWADELGLRNLVQPTGGQRLTYNAVGINGGPDASSVNQGMYSDQTSLGSTALTLAAYFSTTSVLTGRFLFGSAYNDTHYDLRSDFTNPGQMMFRVQTSTVATATIKSDSTTLNDGNAHTVIGTWDGTTMKMYVDGVLQAQTANITGTIIPPSTNNDYNSIGTALDNTNAPFSGWFGRIKGANSASAAINATDAGRLHTWYTNL